MSTLRKLLLATAFVFVLPVLAHADAVASGDCTVAATGVVTCTKINGVAPGTAAFQPSSAFDAAGVGATQAGLRMQFRGAWAASTAYAVNDVVLQAGVLYLAPTAFTSAGTFSASNWTTLTTAGGGSTPVVNTYTVSGAISPADTLSIITCSAACAMTLAQGSDQHAVVVKRVGGSAAPTVALTVDGTAQTFTLASSTTGSTGTYYNSLSLLEVASLSSYVLQ